MGNWVWRRKEEEFKVRRGESEVAEEE